MSITYDKPTTNPYAIGVKLDGKRVGFIQAAKTNTLVWQNANGTFSHHRDHNREWSDEEACRTDLRFHEEWAA